MPALLEEFIVFGTSSLLTLSVVYFKIPVRNTQQIIGILIAVLLISLNKFLFSSTKNSLVAQLKWFLISLSALLVQLTVISSGGVYGPFFILIHLFVLGLSFLISFRSALIFLVFSLAAVTANAILDPSLSEIYKQDVGSIFLYLASFITIIPIASLLAHQYHLKDTLSNILTKQVKLEESIIEGLSELVFVTDLNLSILSFNEAVERALSLSSSEIIGRQLFDILLLKDKNGSLATPQSMSVKEAISDQSARKINGMLLLTKNSVGPKSVNITVRPIPNLEGKIDQVTFVVSDPVGAASANQVKHNNLEVAKAKQEATIEDLKRKLYQKGFSDLTAQADLIKKNAEDLSLAMEIEDHGITPKNLLIDIAQLCRKTMLSEEYFAKTLNTPLDFYLVNFGAQDIAPLVPKGFNISPDQLTAAYFTAPIDVRWFSVLIKKFLEIAIMVTSLTQTPKVVLSVDRQDKTTFLVKITAFSPPLANAEASMLFKEYYGTLAARTNLKLGSGLEGLICKLICTALEIPLRISFDQNPSRINFMLYIKKTPHPNPV